MFVQKKIKEIFPGASLLLRLWDGDKPITTRNGNHLINCRFPGWPELGSLHEQCKNIPGVVEISLFYKMAHEAIIAGNNGIHTYKK
jgi:ribose 5-phosphate isomerase A